MNWIPWPIKLNLFISANVLTIVSLHHYTLMKASTFSGLLRSQNTKNGCFLVEKINSKKSITKNTSLTRWQAVLDSSLLVSALCFFSYTKLDFVFLDDPTKSYVLFFSIILLNFHWESSLPSVCRSLAFLFLQWLSGATIIGDISYNLLVLFKMSCYTWFSWKRLS